jgi:outer membrane autotransporter protein
MLKQDERSLVLWSSAWVVGLGLMLLSASPALANCTFVGTVINCDSSSPNPYPSEIGTGSPGSDNVTLTLQSGSSRANAAQVVTGDSPAISLGSNVTINIGENALVQNTAVSSNGNYSAGGNTIEFNTGSTITIGAGALVLSAGTEPQAEAINPIGDGNKIVNYGTIQGVPGSALFFQNVNLTGVPNVVDNFGSIIAGATNLAFGETPGVNVGVVFTQETGAIVSGNLQFDNGNNTLHLYTGSTITGTVTAGSGSNTVILDGEGMDSSPGVFTNFGTLIKRGAGVWTLTGSPIGAGAAPVTATVEGGTLVLTGNNAAFNGTMTVDPVGTLSGAAASIMPLVTDNGLVQFNQPTNGTYSGLITGSGAVEKIGPAALTITGNEPYTGGTTVTAGTLVVGGFPGSPATLSGTGPVQVSKNGSLTGYGTIDGTVTNNGVVGAGSSLAPLSGGPVGTLTIAGMVNAGSINLAGTTPGNILAVQGNYSGLPGGTLTIGTVLNAGGPLSNQITDRLQIGGNATGITALLLQTRGLGEATGPSSPSSGISVVQVAGTSSPSAFLLPNGFVTGGSPYLYHLNAFGPGSPNGLADPSQNLVGNSSSYWDYRLQSVYEPGGPPATPTRLAVVPQAASYISAATGMFSAQFEDLSELHRRLGEIKVNDPVIAARQQEEVFIRTYGSKLKYSTDQSFADYGYNFSDDYAAVQIGANHMVINNAKGRLRAGLAGVLGRLWLKPSEIVESKTTLNSQTLAAIVTWQAHDEWYVDGILAGGLFSGPVRTPGRGSVVSLAGDSLAASVEVGCPFDLGWRELVLEPEAQLMYGRLKFIHEMDIDAVPLDLGKQSQSILRAGARVLRELHGLPSVRLTSYVEANLLEDLGENHEVLIGNVPFTTGSFGSALQLRGGLNGNISQRFSVFSDIFWQYAVGKAGFLGWGFNLGLRYSF